MVASPKSIWRAPAYLPYLQPPLTADAVASAEERIGFALPPEYLALLEEQNGGYIRLTLPNMVHDKIAGIGLHFPSLTDFDWEETREHVGFELDGLVPFDGDGHWHLCLDYRSNSGSPSVAYIDTECDRESEIATSFASYLSRLRLDMDGQYVLESVADIESVKARLSSLLKMQFGPTDSSAHGYPTHRAGTVTGNEYEWIWLSPNVVPRGFVRENDSRYAALQNLMPGEVARFPELPDGSFLLSMTDEIRSRVLHACTEAALLVRPLGEYSAS